MVELNDQMEEETILMYRNNKNSPYVDEWMIL